MAKPVVRPSSAHSIIPRWTWQRVQDTCREIIERGWIRAEEIVTPVVAFDELLEAYPRIAGDPAAGVKLGVRH